MALLHNWTSVHAQFSQDYLNWLRVDSYSKHVVVLGRSSVLDKTGPLSGGQGDVELTSDTLGLDAAVVVPPCQGMVSRMSPTSKSVATQASYIAWHSMYARLTPFIL